MCSSVQVALGETTWFVATEARDAEDQKLLNRSLAIGPLIVYPDGSR